MQQHCGCWHLGKTGNGSLAVNILALGVVPADSHATEIHTDSIRAMQWLTATIGLFHSCATVRATTATDIRGAAMPGPTTHHELIAQITTNSEWSK